MRLPPFVVIGFSLFASLASSPPSQEEGAGGVPDHVTCIRNVKSGGCRCEIGTGLDLQANEEAVDNCDDLPSGSECCYDKDTDGNSTFCECGVPACYQDFDEYCTCAFFVFTPYGGDVEDASETEVDSCTQEVCCRYADSCECFTLSNTICGGGGEEVASCSAPTARSCEHAPKDSCDSIQWAAE